MNIIELNHIDLNSIGLNSKTIDGVGKSHGGKVKPYIAGHVTDGSSTFTFTVNNNQNITVPVDSSGNWKWVVDRTLTKLEKAFQTITNIDNLKIVYKEDTITSLYMTFQGCSVENLDISKLNTSNVTYWGQAFYNMPNSDYSFVPQLNTESATDLYQAFLSSGTNKQKTLDLRNIETKNVTGNGTYSGISRQVWNNNYLETLHLGRFAAYSKHSGCTVLVSSNGYKNLANVTAEAIAIDMDFKATAKLTEQSVVNIFNAVAADDITLTFHQNVWNMIMREIDVQGSPIQVAYQNMIDNYDVTIANASFDAEIEYLENSGTQWIDTLISPKANSKAEIEFKLNQINEQAIFGCIDNANGMYITSNVSGVVYCNDSANPIDPYTKFIADTKCNLIVYDNVCNINNSVAACGYVTPKDLTIGLFARKVGVNANRIMSGCIYKCKFYEGNTLVRDFIPVRKGTTGYMYDKVSGNLFGNSGTGDFILGNDK